VLEKERKRRRSAVSELQRTKSDNSSVIDSPEQNTGSETTHDAYQNIQRECDALVAERDQLQAQMKSLQQALLEEQVVSSSHSYETELRELRTQLSDGKRAFFAEQKSHQMETAQLRDQLRLTMKLLDQVTEGRPANHLTTLNASLALPGSGTAHFENCCGRCHNQPLLIV
jgi:conjugal transfer/entry exclusion protein